MTETILAPKVRELIEKLSAAIEQHWGFVVQLRNAEADRRSNQEQLGLHQNRLTERHMELARSGSEPPEEPFEEEGLITRISSKGRFYEARVQLCQESVSASQQKVQALKKALFPAFREIGLSLYQRKIAMFEKTARELSAEYTDLMCIKALCDLPGHIQVPQFHLALFYVGPDEVQIPDSRHWSDTSYRGELYEALQALRGEIAQMEACKIEPPLIEPDPDLSTQPGTEPLVDQKA